MKDDGGSAFPMHERDDALKGMSLRDYFAAKALQGICANQAAFADYNPQWEGHKKGEVADELKEVAETAYLLADAMLVERVKS